MGEPLPGDFPDPIYVKTQNILLKATQVGSTGDYARWNPAATASWEVITTTLVPSQGTVIGQGFVQLQQDVNSTGLADAIANAGAFGPGSWFFGLANGTLVPNDYVMLNRTGTQFGFSNERQMAVGTTDMAVATNVATVTTSVPHHLKVGDTVVTTGFTPAAFNATLIVATIVDEDTFTAALVTADATSTVGGLASTPVTGEFAHAQFIKKSGATFNAGAVANDTCVFSMLKGGQPVA